MAAKSDHRELTQQLAQQLSQRNLRLVLAESCTGGRAAALMTEVAGISAWFCGSAVTYRERTKEQWLNVPEEVLQEFTAESSETSDSMALSVLERTSEAGLACAITGHLGPGVDAELDGVVFLSVAVRNDIGLRSGEGAELSKLVYISHRSRKRLDSTRRVERQLEAAHWMLEQILKSLPE